MMQEFFTYLNSLYPLSAEATTALLKVVKSKEFRRGQLILQEGAVCDRLFFVSKGLLKLYFDAGAKEVILQFAKDNTCLLSAQSYFNQAPSRYSMRAIEQTTVLSITKSELDHLSEKLPELNRHLLAISTRLVKELEEHASLLMLVPVQRYLSLQESVSWLVQGKRITDKLLAGYLGVHANAVCEWRKIKPTKF